MFSKSASLFDLNKQIFPGGVNSPVRAFKAVNHTPIFIKSALGAYLQDVDGNSYLDYIGSWGPMICGHRHSKVVEAIEQTLQKGISYGACHELEIELGQQIIQMMPSLEMLRFVTSGTEACMAAIRLARAYTKRPKIIKFAGCYHGHYDSFLVQAGSGVATLGLPDSPGVLPQLAELTLSLPYNSLSSVEEAFQQNPDSIAGIILEPVVGNAGCILPKPSFLQGLRKLCDDFGALLIFDEVMTGFRVAAGGAQKYFGVKPDLTTLGKIIGGGLPVGAFGGKREIMSLIAPAGPVYQAGTLAGNPLGMASGLATLKLLSEPGVYQALEKTGDELAAGLTEIAAKYKIPLVINRCGAMFAVFFNEGLAVINYKDAQKSNLERFAKFFKLMLEQGIYLPPSQFEACFFSLAHGKPEINKTLTAANQAFAQL